MAPPAGAWAAGLVPMAWLIAATVVKHGCDGAAIVFDEMPHPVDGLCLVRSRRRGGAGPIHAGVILSFRHLIWTLLSQTKQEGTFCFSPEIKITSPECPVRPTAVSAVKFFSRYKDANLPRYDAL